MSDQLERLLSANKELQENMEVLQTELGRKQMEFEKLLDERYYWAMLGSFVLLSLWQRHSGYRDRQLFSVYTVSLPRLSILIVLQAKESCLGEVFNRISLNQNQSYHTGRSQRTHTIREWNENLKQIRVADAKRGEIGASESRMGLISLLIGCGRGVVFFKPIILRRNAIPK